MHTFIRGTTLRWLSLLRRCLAGGKRRQFLRRKLVLSQFKTAGVEEVVAANPGITLQRQIASSNLVDPHAQKRLITQQITLGIASHIVQRYDHPVSCTFSHIFLIITHKINSIMHNSQFMMTDIDTGLCICVVFEKPVYCTGPYLVVYMRRGTSLFITV